MNSTPNSESPGAIVGETLPEKCSVCSYPPDGHWFCIVHTGAASATPLRSFAATPASRKPSPIVLCCPDCMIHYLNSTHSADDPEQQEMRTRENRLCFFIGENKPWS